MNQDNRLTGSLFLAAEIDVARILAKSSLKVSEWTLPSDCARMAGKLAVDVSVRSLFY